MATEQSAGVIITRGIIQVEEKNLYILLHTHRAALSGKTNHRFELKSLFSFYNVDFITFST